MAESNGGWGDLAEHDDDLAAQWDGYARLPDPGENDVLDGFLAAKNLDHAALIRLGARLSAPNVLAFPFKGGVKYREMESGRRWASAGAEFTAMKIIKARA